MMATPSLRGTASPQGEGGGQREADRWPSQQGALRGARHGMDADSLRPAGVYFATTTGELYGSNTEGDSWMLMGKGLPRVQGVTAAVG